MGAGNTLRVIVAFLLIKMVRVPWRIVERALHKQLPVRDHYLIMRMFQLLFREYRVQVTYPNPVARSQDSMSLALNLCENNQLALFRMKQWYERDWIRAISMAMDDAEAFIDIGANVGVFAVSIAQAHPNRQVVAIEPVPSNFAKLKDNARLNNLSNLRCVQAAVSGGGESVTMYVNPVNDGGGSIIEFDSYRTADILIDSSDYQRQHPEFVPSIDVPAIRLDDLITGKSVLKIDVEGAEVEVLESGMNAFKSGSVELMVVEVTGETVSAVTELLETAGFDCLVEGGKSLVTGSAHFNGRLGNIVCLKRDSALRDLLLDKAAAIA
jgi:FkbM family methyltransferase